MKKILSIVISLALLVGCMAVATVSASAERLARYTVLVLDVSGSMEDNGRLDSEKKAAIKFCETATKNSSNKVALLTFSSHVEYTGEFTNDLEELKKEINALEPLGGTNFCESLAAANKLLNDEQKKSTKFERNIVFCSDGLPQTGDTLETYKYTPTDDRSYFRYGNAALKYDDVNIKPNTNVYTIGFFQGLTGTKATFAPQLMKDLANRLSTVAETEDELIKAFENFAGDITRVETPDTPTQPSSGNSGTTTTTTTNAVQNPSNAAEIAAAIQTGSPLTYVVIIAAAFVIFGAVAVSSKKSYSKK